MRLGIFAKTFVRPTLEETLDAVKAHGLDCVQFNMACAGLPSLPDQIDAALCARIRREMEARDIKMAAVSGTFNMIHPDPQKRQDGLRRLRVLAQACPLMGTETITLCTGTRDPDNMWRRHPANDTPEAWQDLKAILADALDFADEAKVTLAFEPEVANVVDTVWKARNLLFELRSPRLKVVFDPANLFRRGDLFRMHEILDEAFRSLATDIVLAHAKDLNQASVDGEVSHVAAGKGLLDYDYYLTGLRKIGFEGPLIAHGLEESEVGECLAFLRKNTLGFRPLPS
jgi:sugar phosphate isomerase/epimerase